MSEGVKFLINLVKEASLLIDDEFLQLVKENASFDENEKVIVTE